MENFENYCMNCMNDKGDSVKCPFCGYEVNNQQYSKFINKKVILQDKYILGRKISENSESIDYIGYDLKNKCKIYIKEFFPKDICVRKTDKLTVIAKNNCTEKYQSLKKDFLEYFRSLAKVRQMDAIIPLYDIFTEYETIYVVFEVVEGISLYDLIKKNGKPLDWDTVKLLFMPLLTVFSKLNEFGLLHLAINPKNLIIGKDSKLHISGFATRNLRQSGVFTVWDFNSGFTAPEQYIKGHPLTQATDVYGFSATFFFALVGFAPKDAVERSLDERLLIPVRVLKAIPPHIVFAIANGLNVNEKKRTSTFAILRDELTETSAKYLKEQDDNSNEFYESDNKGRSSKFNNIKLIIFSTVITVLIFFSTFFLLFNNTSNNQKDKIQVEDDLMSKKRDSQEGIIVPDFVGQDIEQIKKLDNQSDNYTIFFSDKVFDDVIEEGKVVSQIPEAGTLVKKGSNIVLSVSKGKNFRALPNISGLSLSDASDVLTKQGFIPQKIDQYSDEVEQGLVIGYKSNNVGDKLKYASEVVIIVSKGRP